MPFQSTPVINKQRGMMLMTLLFVVGVAAAAYLLGALRSEKLQLERNQKSSEMLAQGKAALIGYAIGVIAGGQRPGDLVLPDYFATSEAPANYDGDTDACQNAAGANGLPLITSGSNMRCLGRLPWKALGMSLTVVAENDAAGTMPWYGVSANLVDPACLAVLNSDTLNLSYTGYNCGGASLPHPWLTVRDHKGNIVSSRVAFVLLIPGAAINNQSRTVSPNLSGAGAYLDSITVDAGCSAPCVPGTYSNADLDNDFVLPADHDSRQFNDRVLYVTIDELMAQVEKRAAGTAKAALRDYYAGNGYYPFAAALGDVENGCVQSNTAGLIPLHSSATCSSGTNCTASFSGITSVVFDLDAVNYASRSGACSYSGSKCTCTGVGYCSRSSWVGTYRFECYAAGNCVSTGPFPQGKFTYYFPVQTPDNTVRTGACSIDGPGEVDCDGAGSFRTSTNTCTHANPTLSGYLPTWFLENQWDDLIYYVVAAGCTAADPNCAGAGRLTVGGRSDVHSLLVSVGSSAQSAPFAVKGSAQARPSADILDYLDSVENTNLDNSYDRVGTARTMTYNDQMFVVAP